MARLSRFHREIFFPDWADESMKQYIDGIFSSGPLTFSLHSVEKLQEYTYQFGKNFFLGLVKGIRDGILDPKKVFEFYSKKDKTITKVCFRHSFDKMPVDVILVVSSGGVIITLYVASEGDNHKTLNRKLYKKGE